MDDYSPDDFLKCPSCFRPTVEMTMHLDGDVALECVACGAFTMAYPLNQSERVYSDY